VCLDVPQMTEFGVDYEVFRTGPKFQGVKFLPLGVHLVVFRAKEQEHGIRQGFFLRVERHAQVLVREWSADKEELAPPRPGLNLEALERTSCARHCSRHASLSVC
jgi:A1 cistron-splicing factor AAR2